MENKLQPQSSIFILGARGNSKPKQTREALIKLFLKHSQQKEGNR